MIFWVRTDGSFLYVNPAVSAKLGYTRNELYKGGTSLILAEISEEARMSLRNRLRLEQSISLKTTLRCKDGTLIPVAATMNHVISQEDEIDCAFCRDITEETIKEKILIDENERLELQNNTLKEVAGVDESGLIVGISDAIRKTIRIARKFSPNDMSVLITGESGVGKELFARFIHNNSSRAKAPFVEVNCSNLQSGRVLSDMFGHVKGAYTDARKDRRGAFELAEGGTLLLDELGELPIDVQPMLLRVLQERRYKRMGDEKMRSCNVRIIAATNQSLLKKIKKGHFREDLYHRLSALEICIPPLRERPEDITVLIDHFLRQLNEKEKVNKQLPKSEDIAALHNFRYSGNVRELQNYVKRSFILSPGDHLEFNEGIINPSGHFPSEPASFLSLEEVQRQHIIKALKLCRGKVSGVGGAAQLMNINPNTLTSRIRKLDLHRHHWK